MAEKNCSDNGAQDQETPSTSEGDKHLMKIFDEFVMIRGSMEMFPLPGNRVEPQLEDNLGFGSQTNGREYGKGMRATDLLTSLALYADTTKHKIKELSENAMDEVTKMFNEGEPLWQHDLDRGIEVLNNVEYVRRFSPNLETTLEDIIKIVLFDDPLGLPHDLDRTTNNNQKPRPGLLHAKHASRETGYVQMPAICIVEILMDVRMWSFVFSEMLSRAAVLGILSSGAPGTHDGDLQVMTSEYHAPSPLLPTRQSCFARYCKQLSCDTWAIVDISLESTWIDNPLMNCKRRPSGCLIQGLLDGTTKITWIEHTETEITSISPLFKSIVDSGLIFSAKQWVDTLVRQCQRLDFTIQHSLCRAKGGSFWVEGLLRLAERMRREFYGAISSTKGNQYQLMPIKGGDNILVKTLDGDGQNPTLFTVTTSSWFPFTRKKVFEFVGNERNRTKWYMLAFGHASHEVFSVHSGQGPEDMVSITKMVDENGSIDSFFLQEKHETAVTSYVILSPITYNSIVMVSNQGNIDEIPLLPSGFAILSDKLFDQQEGSEGSVVTVSFQLLDSSSRAVRDVNRARSIRNLYSLVTDIISSIRIALFDQEDLRNR